MENKNEKIRTWRNLTALSLLIYFAGIILVSLVLGGKGDVFGLTPTTTMWLGVIIYHGGIGLSIWGTIKLASAFRLSWWITVVLVILMLWPLMNLPVAFVFVIYATRALHREAQQSAPSNPRSPSANGFDGR